MCAAYINGLQSEGVSASKYYTFLFLSSLNEFLAIKHYVGNDQEHERTAAESVVSTRALREIYLYPWAKAPSI
jgi:beta-glucosidase